MWNQKKLGLLFNEDLVEHRTSKSCRVITKGRHFVLLHCIMTAWKLWAFQLSVRITLLQRKAAPLRPWTYSDIWHLLTECQLFYTLLLILSFYLQLNITTNIDTEGFIKHHSITGSINRFFVHRRHVVWECLGRNLQSTSLWLQVIIGNASFSIELCLCICCIRCIRSTKEYQKPKNIEVCTKNPRVGD
jgi:hypothetical protein